MALSNVQINNFDKLIHELNSIDWNAFTIEPTFMDIAGFPHYENVCSNILAFFIQTDAVHNLKDLLLKALLNGMKISYQQVYITKEVNREVMTSTGKRIDLVIETDDFVLAIENKIYASLDNDLPDYSTYLDQSYPQKNRYKMVLSLSPVEQSSLKSGFINVSYFDLFTEIDQLMGDYWQQANYKYLLILNDFTKNIKKLMGENQMDKKGIDYFVKNGDDIKKLMLEVKNYKDYLRKTLQDLSNQINITNASICERWYYRETNELYDDLVHDISFNDAVIAIDTVLGDEKYNLYIWLRKAGKSKLRNKNELVDFLAIKGIAKSDLFINQERHVYHQEISNQQDVVNQLNDIISKLCQ